MTIVVGTLIAALALAAAFILLVAAANRAERERQDDIELARLAAARANEPAVRVDLDELDETAYLLSSPANRERLEKALANVRAGNAVDRTAQINDAWGKAVDKRPRQKVVRRVPGNRGHR